MQPSMRMGRCVGVLSVVLAAIDYFKFINDTHGHHAGNEILRKVSPRLETQTRQGDGLRRFGGEEFLFMLYPCSKEEVLKAGERFRKAIAEIPVEFGGDEPSSVKVTISLGAASTQGRNDVGMEALLKRADHALYRSKACGRNRVTFA